MHGGGLACTVGSEEAENLASLDAERDVIYSMKRAEGLYHNTTAVIDADGSYLGTVNLTMTGLWRLHLTVRDAEGNIVAGGEELSTLFWDVTI